jgi:hypothetical protein
MSKKYKKKLSYYDLCVRAVFEEINKQLGVLVDMQRTWEDKHLEREHQFEVAKSVLTTKKNEGAAL